MKQKILSAALSRIRIIFDRKDGKYSAGEVLSGRVEIDFQNEIKVKAVKLNFHGTARVGWDERRAYTKGSASKVEHKNANILLDHTMVLLKKDSTTNNKSPRQSICLPMLKQDDDGVLICPGLHKYHFEYTIPVDLPSTFDGKWGHIIYSTRFTLETSRTMSFDLVKERKFVVTGILDLNDEPETVRPIAGSWDFYPGKLCCNSGAITVDVRLGRKGFVIGESIPFFVEITNGSRRKMADSKVALVQHAIFRAEDRIRKSTHIVTQLAKGEILPGQTCTWEQESLSVPHDIVPSCTKNKVVQIKYSLSLLLIPSGWNPDEFVLPVQIIIGTVNLKRSTVVKYFNQLGLDFRVSQTMLPQTPYQNNLSRGPQFKSSRQSLPNFMPSAEELKYIRGRRQSTGSVDSSCASTTRRSSNSSVERFVSLHEQNGGSKLSRRSNLRKSHSVSDENVKGNTAIEMHEIREESESNIANDTASEQ